MYLHDQILCIKESTCSSTCEFRHRPSDNKNDEQNKKMKIMCSKIQVYVHEPIDMIMELMNHFQHDYTYGYILGVVSFRAKAPTKRRRAKAPPHQGEEKAAPSTLKECC